MLKKTIYLALVILAAAAVFVIWKRTGSETEIQKLRAQIYDLQKQVEKQAAAAEEAKKVPEKEERVISAAVTAPSQTPPSVVRQGRETAQNDLAKSKEPLLNTADSNDFAQSLSAIQEEVEAQALQETLGSVAEAAETNATKNIDMSQIDAIIREAEEKLVAQYGEKILENDKVTKAADEAAKQGEKAGETFAEVKKEAARTEKEAVRKVAEQRDFASREAENARKDMSEIMKGQETEKVEWTITAAESAPAAGQTSVESVTTVSAAREESKDQAVEKPSWEEDELPGSRPTEASLTDDSYFRGPREVGNNYSSHREVRPVHGDNAGAAPAPSFYQNNGGAPRPVGRPSFSQDNGAQNVQNAGSAQQRQPVRSSSLRPASEVIVPTTAKQEVERDIRAEEARRRPPERIRKIPAKNYNALGNKTMSEVMKEGM